MKSLNGNLSFSADWIKSVSKESGELKAGGTQGVIVNIDRSLLESGENETTIHVTSNDGNKQLAVKATDDTVLPTLNTLEATNITSSSAVLNAEILTKGVPSYSKRGFVYALESNPTLENTISDLTAKVTEENLYSATATGLELGETYYVRGYAINEAGVAYSTNEVKFFPEMDLPNVTTEEATNINLDSESATFNGTIVDEGDPAYTERGFVYGFTHNPSVENTKIEVIGSGKGQFSANVTGLEVGKVYYIRAYAINDKGVTYGSDVMLDLNGTVPQVKTKPATDLNIGAGTAVFHGEIVSVGDPTYTERGFVYGHDHNPTVEDDNKKEGTGNGEGAFSVKVTELEINTIYYIRAYATNAVGTFYGDEVVLNFNAVMPVVTTSAVTAKNIGAGTATFNGEIVSVGDPAYTERGFVYALTHSPTIDDTKKVVSGTGTGAFSANVTGLTMNKIYYIRAYATSDAGTIYGSEVSADFSVIMPVVTTSAATSINLTVGTATFNGSITSIGDPAYTERGFVYGTVHNPTVEDDTKKIAAGSGTGAFSANVNGLVLNTTYYIRAYAKTSQGTSYGSEVSLVFKGTVPTVKTSAATNVSIASKTATFNGSIENVGNPAYTERGFVYGLTHNPNIVDDTKKAASGSGTGAFSASVTNLEMNKTYYIRAYATNLQGTAYGSEVTLDFSQVLPVVTTQAASDIDTTTATFNGTIESIGDPAYTERGFIYGTMQVPTIEDDGVLTVSASGTGTGPYARTVSSFTTGTTYYVRAYAKVGTLMVYGNIVSFVPNPKYYVILSTGLIVAKEDAGRANWDNANTLCNNSTLAGFNDWHLPTEQELLIVYDNRNLIGNFKSDLYWSSTTAEGYSNRAFNVSFSSGNVNFDYKSGSYYVRCVRTAD